MHINRHALPVFLRFFTLLGACFLLGTAVRAQVSVTATGGTTGPTAYTTLKAAFDAVNSGTHTGVITISVNAGTTETATAALNASGSGSASFTRVVVKAGTGATPTITGAIANGPVVKLNGANNIVFEGSNTGGTSRDLTISNTSTTTPQVLVIGSVGTVPVTNDTLRNCTLINGANTSTCLIVSDAATPGAAGYFNNICLKNNSVQKAYIGMYVISVATGTNGSGTLVTGNDLNSTGANAVRLCGIYAQGVNGTTISNNNVGNFETVNAEFDRAIWIATGTNNSTVSGNTVSGLGYTGTTAGYAPIGINVSPGITTANISVTGNTVTNISSASTGTSTGIYFFSAASGVTIDKNQVSNIKNTNTGGYGAAGILLAGTLTTSAVNIVNNFVWDIAGYGTNLWTSGSNGNGIVADGGGGYNIYFNSVWLNTNETAVTGTRSAAVLITTNVTAAGSINLRNNLLINTQTVGNVNSRLALAVTAPTTVFSTFNYNDYYSTSGNLAGQGSNATLWSTIGQIQSNMGSNANSVSILPSFTSSTDLHLPGPANAALDNLGISIAAITDDIDGQARSTTPDMGADEFSACNTITYTTQPTSVTVCDGANVTFTAAATNATLYQWQVNTGSGFTNVANGGAYSGATTATLSITAATTAMSGYTYRLQSQASSTCPQAASNTVTLTVNPLPNVTVTASGPTAICTGGSVTLSVPNNPNQNFQWKNGTTNVPGATGNSYTATATGNYSIVVINTVTGCTATSAVTAVSVGSGPIAVITPANVAVCQGFSTTLSAGTAGGVTYQWYVNNVAITGATNNTYTTSTGGSYTVTVTSGPSCSTTSSPATVTVNPLPAATATAAGATAICQGTSVTLNANTGAGLTYQWLLNNAIIASATNAAYSANAAGSYRVKVTATATGCRDTSTPPIVITVNPLPTASITPTTLPAICQGDTSLLTANTGAGFSYQWYLNGNAIAGATGGTYKAFAAGNYTVEVINANGCRKVSTAVSLTINPLPPAFITYSSPLSFCDGSAVVLTAYPGAGLTYQWYKDGTAINGATTTNYTVTDQGSYTIRVVNTANSCINNSAPVPVTVYALPVPSISVNNFVLSTGSYANYQWYLNNVAIGPATQQTYTPTANGAYKVKVTSTDGCEGSSEIFFLNGLKVGGVAGDKIELLVYPSPASSAVTIENKSGLRLESVSIINSIGSIVQEVTATANNKMQVRVDGLANGIYYIRIATESGIALRRIEVLR